MIELSLAEAKLLQLVCRDKDNSEIAQKMEFGLRRVEKIKTGLYRKTKTKSNVGLLKWAVRNELYVLK